MKYTTKYDSSQLPVLLGEKRSRYHLKNNTSLTPEIAESYPDDFISKTTGITKRDIADEILSVNNCSRHVVYVSANQVDKDNGDIKEIAGAVLEADACNNQILCAQCAAHKRNETIQSISSKIKTMEKISGLHYYLLTLTIPTCSIDDVRKNYDMLRDSWTDFTKMGQRRGGLRRSGGEMAKCIGYVLGIEVVKAVNDLYHIHGHCFVVTTSPLDFSTYDKDKKAILRAKYGNNIPNDELKPIAKDLVQFRSADGTITGVPLSPLSRQWYESTGGRAVDIHCTPIERKQFDFLSGEYKNTPLITSCYEVVKYATKSWEVDPVDLVRLWISLAGTRRITKGGVFAGGSFYRDLWGVLVDKGLCRDFWEKIVSEYCDSTLSEERKKFSTYKEFVNLYEFKGKDYFEQDSTYIKEKYSDLERKHIYDVLKGVIVSTFIRFKREIVKNIDNFGEKISVVRKNSLTDIMRGMMRGVSNCMYYEITGKPVSGHFSGIVFKLVSVLRKDLFFGRVMVKSKSFSWVSSEIKRVLSAFDPTFQPIHKLDC